MPASTRDAAPPPGSAAAGRAERYQDYFERSGARRAGAEELERRSKLVSNLRGLSFAVLAVAFVSAAATDTSPRLEVAVGCLATLAFAILVWWHARVLNAEDLAWRFWRVNENAAQRARDEFSTLPGDGAQFQDPAHPFSGDLDLFGPGSLFQFMNVAHTSYGQAALARHLSSADTHAAIVERQAAVRELGPRLELRQELEAYCLRAANPPGQVVAKSSSVLDLSLLLSWAEEEPVLTPRHALVWAARILPLLGLAGVVAAQVFEQSPLCWAVPLTAQLLLAVRGASAANHVFAAVSSSPGAFSRLRPSLRLLENAKFEAPLLQRLGAVLRTTGGSASDQMNRFERVLSWFELRHNGMVYPFINVALLWDIHCVVAFEKWQARSGRALRPWLAALGEWEALSSLAGLAHDNPEFVFPEVVNAPSVFEAHGLGHPLIGAKGRVENDVILGGPGSALLVTGSNMSGKSTLLRAMGLGAVLAFAGTAVCARRMRVSPLGVYTSMRVSDSLAQGVSHFYAELQKLRAALLGAQEGQAVFFLLDEILHGTNSEERQVGARWILSTLIQAGGTGAVSTHDMALCALPPELMQRVRTVHLRESVEGERMSFDYKVRPGPVSGGNALRLMRSLGLSVPLLQSAASQPRDTGA